MRRTAISTLYALGAVSAALATPGCGLPEGNGGIEDGAPDPDKADGVGRARVVGELELRLQAAPQYTLLLQTQLNPHRFLLNGMKCYLTRGAHSPDPKLRCPLSYASELVIERRADAYAARLSFSGYRDSAGRSWPVKVNQPICPWGVHVEEAARAAACFPAGVYESNTDATPELRLAPGRAMGYEPFAVAARVDEALGALVGVAQLSGRTIAEIPSWAMYGVDGGVVQPAFVLSDGTRIDCHKDRRPRVFADGRLLLAGEFTNLWRRHLEAPSSSSICPY